MKRIIGGRCSVVEPVRAQPSASERTEDPLLGENDLNLRRFCANSGTYVR